MRSILFRVCACAVPLFLTGCVTSGARPASSATQSAGPASAQLKAILDEHVEQLLRDDPVSTSTRGDRRYNSLLEDLSPAAYSARRAAYADRLTRLRTIDPATLNVDERLNADLLRGELERTLDSARFMPEQTPADNRGNPAIGLAELASRVPMNTEQDRADYVARLEAMPVLIDQTITQMKAGLAAGRVPPRVTVDQVPAQARRMASLRAHTQDSAFFEPFKDRPQGDPLAERARSAIAGPLADAFARFADFTEREYVPACRESIAASQGIDGMPAYEHALHVQTTTRLTAEQIHALGLSEVARIRALMFRVIARTDYPHQHDLKGDELFAAFTTYLRTNPRFYCAQPADLVAGYRAVAKRADAQLPRLFSTLPRNPYGVREMPPAQAESAPTAYYYGGSLRSGIPGYFMANTYRLDQRPKYEMIPLTLHEAMPGHHLERTLTEELEGLHPIRSLLGYTAFVEGWGLYSERLGMEMEGPIRTSRELDDALGAGLYADPYDDFGRLSYEMWRALRLVVDTGIHAQGWSRQRAIDYMLANSALSRVNVEREVDRYISWPGQACAYKIGELTLRRLRARAEDSLGQKFDLRAFHHAVLGSGPVPLDVLERRINDWIAAGGT